MNASQYLRLVALMAVPIIAVTGLYFDIYLKYFELIINYVYDAKNMLWIANNQYKVFLSKGYFVNVSDFVWYDFIFRLLILISIIRILVGIVFIEHGDVSVNLLKMKGMSYKKFLITCFLMGVVAIIALSDTKEVLTIVSLRMLFMYSANLFLSLESIVLAGAIAFLTEGVLLSIWLLFRRQRITSG